MRLERAGKARIGERLAVDQHAVAVENHQQCRPALWLSPSAPSSNNGGAPPPSDAGLSGESLSIMECQLVGRISRSSRGGIGSVWFADVRDGSSGEQASADEFGEADGRHLETAVSGGDAQQQIGDHGGQQLQSDGVWIASE